MPIDSRRRQNIMRIFASLLFKDLCYYFQAKSFAYAWFLFNKKSQYILSWVAAVFSSWTHGVPVEFWFPRGRFIVCPSNNITRIFVCILKICVTIAKLIFFSNAIFLLNNKFQHYFELSSRCTRSISSDHSLSIALLIIKFGTFMII